MMGNLNKEFERFIEKIYQRHDKIQSSEEGKMNRMDQNLQELELVAEKFEQKMERAAFDIEEWLKNRDRHQK
ncbi:hypothetical protein [Metabacillus fastidiosus]|uniref:hypothetical protein n=2 Tax=Metabacillus fastidiosus TaxID=1458 RepID=UPI003D265E80